MRIFSFILLICFSSIKAQLTEYETGRTYPTFDSEKYYFISLSTRVVAVKTKGKLLTVQTFDPTEMKQLESSTYDDLPKGWKIEDVLKIGDNIYTFYSARDKKANLETLYARKVNPSDGKLGPPEIVLEVNKRISDALARGFNFQRGSMFGIGNEIRKFNIIPSPNGQKVLIQYRLLPEIKNDDLNKDVIGFAVLNQSLGDKISQEVEMPYTESKMNNLDYSFDNEGNIDILAMVYKDDTQDQIKDGEMNYNLEVLQLRSGFSSKKKYEINHGAMFLNNMKSFCSEDGNIIGVGYYSKGENSANVDGILYFNMTSSGEVLAVRNSDFSAQLISKYAESKRDIKEEMRFLVLNEVTLLEDDGVIVAGEQTYITNRTRGSSTIRTFSYDNVVLAKLNSNGTMDWSVKIPKKQLGFYGRAGMSYKTITNNNYLNVLYLDNVKNKNLSEAKSPEQHADGAGGYLSAWKINISNGEVRKGYAFDIRSVKGKDLSQFKVDRIVLAPDNSVLLEMYYKDKRDILVRLKEEL